VTELPGRQQARPPDGDGVAAGAVPLAACAPGTSRGRARRGAHPPFAIRWFGMTALWGHLRHLLAVTAASNQLDLRDWMRAEDADDLLRRVGGVLDASDGGSSLAERLGREVWIDFVADTGDDHDVSLAVGRMLFAEYALGGSEPRTLPRGDLLIFGGDTAYPAATAHELERRLLQPWNSVLAGTRHDTRRRVVLGIPGNHDWYDGLDGFARLFRRSATEDFERPAARGPAPPPGDSSVDRIEGALLRHLHVDEIAESLRVAGEAFESLAALVLRTGVRRPRRLALDGYTAVQEASYWALPLAPGLHLWGVDRQLRTADFRQRVFFAQQRAASRPRRILLVAPDPALAYGEPNEPGTSLLDACGLSLTSSPIFYLTGDVHHYERQRVGDSLHVIAGGGGAFLHGTRIAPDAGSLPPERVYPDRRTSRRLALGMPMRLAGGTAGLLPHLVFGLLAAVEIASVNRAPVPGAVVVGLGTLFTICAMTLAVRARLARPAATWAVCIPFGLVLGLAPLALRHVLSGVLPTFGILPAVVAHAFVGSFVLGLFLLVLALTGLEHQQGFAALGHPGFRHVVRLCVHPSGAVEGFVIGKDDPVGEEPPVLVDRFRWQPGA
jgi:hypothetical protein